MDAAALGSDRAGEPWAEDLSALCDGELGDEAAADLCARIARDEAGALRWHQYHRIGDALRSSDLCLARDEQAFLDRFRARLEVEPVVIAPAALPAGAAQPSRVQALRRWRFATGVSAGVAVVALGLGLWGQLPGTGGERDAGLARSGGGGAELLVVKTANGAMIRDARLEQYLAAHHRAGSPVAMPAAFVRQASVQPNPACTNC
jgi:sigma-E factor negative regulatory protein RseA